MTFQQLDAKLRTNEDFHNMTAEDHHTGISPFTELLTIGCVTNFPLDYMHLVCLGVVPRTVMLWMSGPLSCRMSGTQVRQVSGELLRFRNHLPKAPFTHRALPRRNARCRTATRVAAASMTLKLNWFNFSVILTRVAARYRAATRVKMTC